MKLLMITRKVDANDHLAGFTYNWVKKMGAKLERLYVITWQKSNRGGLPENIEIISLPENKIKKILILQRHLSKILPKVRGVFCHMNPEYTILSAPLAKFFGKKVLTWYTHGSVSWKLKLVGFLTDKIITASKESCRLKNRNKIEVVGHGIDTEHFRSNPQSAKSALNPSIRIISVGRISPSKGYETMIEAIDILANQDVIPAEAGISSGKHEIPDFANTADKQSKNSVLIKAQIIGAPGLKSQEEYFQKLKNLVKEKQLQEDIEFLGAVPHNRILPYLQKADLFINLSSTGSVDKAVLEAMSCGVPVLTSNEAFEDILKNDKLIFEKGNSRELSEKIKVIFKMDTTAKEELGQNLRKTIKQDYDLNKLVDKIVTYFK